MFEDVFAPDSSEIDYGASTSLFESFPNSESLSTYGQEYTYTLDSDLNSSDETTSTYGDMTDTTSKERNADYFSTDANDVGIFYTTEDNAKTYLFSPYVFDSYAQPELDTEQQMAKDDYTMSIGSVEMTVKRYETGNIFQFWGENKQKTSEQIRQEGNKKFDKKWYDEERHDVYIDEYNLEQIRDWKYIEAATKLQMGRPHFYKLGMTYGVEKSAYRDYINMNMDMMNNTNPSTGNPFLDLKNMQEDQL